jgi:hypothetical protein
MSRQRVPTMSERGVARYLSVVLELACRRGKGLGVCRGKGLGVRFITTGGLLRNGMLMVYIVASHLLDVHTSKLAHG